MSEIQANNVPFAGGMKPFAEICDLLWTVTNRRQQVLQRPGIVGICGAPPTPAENGQSHREYQAALIFWKRKV